MLKYIGAYIFVNYMFALVCYMGGAEIGTFGAGAGAFFAQCLSVAAWAFIYQETKVQK